MAFWTLEVERKVKESYPDEDSRLLAKELGCSYGSLKRRAHFLGVRKSVKGRIRFWDEEKLEILRERYPEEGPEKLAREWKKSVISVTGVAFRYGIRYTQKDRNRSKFSKSVDVTFFDVWSVSSAWLLGYIWSDGNISRDLRTLDFGCHPKDADILIQVKTLLKSKHKLSYKYGVSNGRGGIRDRVRLAVSNSFLVSILRDRFGIEPTKSKLNLPFPEVPEDFLPHFTRGVLDGDGCLTQGTYIRWEGSELFIRGLQKGIVRSTGVKENRVSPHDSIFRIQWGAREDLRKLSCWLYPSGVYPFGKRKRETLTKYIELGFQKALWEGEEVELLTRALGRYRNVRIQTLNGDQRVVPKKDVQVLPSSRYPS